MCEVTVNLPHHMRCSAASASQRGAGRSRSSHPGRSRSGPPGARCTCCTQSRPDASTHRGQPVMQIQQCHRHLSGLHTKKKWRRKSSSCLECYYYCWGTKGSPLMHRLECVSMFWSWWEDWGDIVLHSLFERLSSPSKELKLFPDNKHWLNTEVKDEKRSDIKSRGRNCIFKVE